VHADRLARGGAGRPDALQCPVEYLVSQVELAAKRERQVPRADVDPVDAVDGHGGGEIFECRGRLGHDEAERVRRGQHAAR
jgi:hypothetical protein